MKKILTIVVFILITITLTSCGSTTNNKLTTDGATATPIESSATSNVVNEKVTIKTGEADAEANSLIDSLITE